MGEARHSWEVPASWEHALAAARQGGTLLLVGSVDAGKSTLAAILAREAWRAGRATAVVDADVGQASIGPPTCVSVGLVTQEIERLDDLAPEAVDFVGSPSPMGHLLQCATSAAVMVAAAGRAGAETIVVDTTGLISGPAARALKSAKIRLVGADAVIALQTEDEVEHLLAPYAHRARPRVLRLGRSRRVKERSREERTARRQERLGAYFANGGVFQARWSDLPMESTAWTTGEPVPGHVRAHAEELLGCEVVYAERRADGVFVVVSGRPDQGGLRALGEGFGGTARACEVGSLENRLVGLLGEEGDTLALGILESMDFRARRLTIYTPLKDPAQARGLRMGAVQVARDGTQLAWNESGDVG